MAQSMAAAKVNPLGRSEVRAVLEKSGKLTSPIAHCAGTMAGGPRGWVSTSKSNLKNAIGPRGESWPERRDGGGGGTNPADSGKCLISLHWPRASASKLSHPWYLGCDLSFDRFRSAGNPILPRAPSRSFGLPEPAPALGMDNGGHAIPDRFMATFNPRRSRCRNCVGAP